MDCEEGVCAVPKKVSFGENLVKEFDKNDPADCINKSASKENELEESDKKETDISWIYVIALVIVLIIVIIIISHSKSNKDNKVDNDKV